MSCCFFLRVSFGIWRTQVPGNIGLTMFCLCIVPYFAFYFPLCFVSDSHQVQRFWFSHPFSQNEEFQVIICLRSMSLSSVVWCRVFGWPCCCCLFLLNMFLFVFVFLPPELLVLSGQLTGFRDVYSLSVLTPDCSFFVCQSSLLKSDITENIV